MVMRGAFNGRNSLSANAMPVSDGRSVIPSLGLARFAGICLLGVMLTGCSTVDGWFSSAPAPKLPGKRISVMALDQSLQADPDLQNDTIYLPDPVANIDWSQPGGSPTNAMYNLSASTKFNKVWSSSAGEGSSGAAQLTASPIVVAGRIYVLDAESTLRAFDAKSGDRIWSQDLVPEDDDPAAGRGGGVAFDNGRLFIATGFGVVYAVNPADGSVIWKQNVGDPFRSSPTAIDGRVFAVTADNQTVALSQDKGNVLWRQQGIAETAGILAATSPAVEASTVIAPYSSGEVYALRVENGNATWNDSLTRTGNMSSLTELNDIAGRPVIDDGKVYAISHSGRMVAIDLRTGERIWTRDIGGVQTPWVAGDYIFLVTLDSELVALQRSDGRVRWIVQLQKFKDPEDTSSRRLQWSGPVLADGQLVLVSSGGQMIAASAEDGKITSQTDLPEGSLIPPIVANGFIYVLTNDATLLSFN